MLLSDISVVFQFFDMVPSKEQLAECYRIIFVMICCSEVVLRRSIIELFHTLLCKLCEITIKGQEFRDMTYE